MKKWEYEELLERIEAENPTEILLRDLRSGYSPANVFYIKAAAARLEIKQKNNEAERDQQANDADEVDFLKKMYRIQQLLRSDRNKLSNSFHNCTTDAERAAVSQKISANEAEDRANEVAIAVFQENGTEPDPFEKYPLPDDPILLMKKINSLRAQVSQAKKRLDGLAALDDANPEKSQIPEVERRLFDLKIHLQHGENAREAQSKAVHRA